MIKNLYRTLFTSYNPVILTFLLVILENNIKNKTLKTLTTTWGCISYILIIFTKPDISQLNTFLRSFALTYIGALIYILKSEKSFIRHILFQIDSSLGRKIKYKNTICCEVTIRNIINIFDKFTLAHFFGHFVKGLLFRNYILCWINSVCFEMIEISLRQHIHEFYECWWDSIFHDIFLCNMSGFFLGIRFCKLLGAKMYHWTHPGLYTWKNLADYYVMVILSGFFLLFEINTFYLKDLLYIPSTHYSVPIRLVVQAVLGHFAIEEVYRTLVERQRNKLFYFPAVLVIIVLETCICFRYGRGEFKNKIPNWVFYFWSSGFVVVGLLPFIVIVSRKILKKGQNFFCKENLLRNIL